MKETVIVSAARTAIGKFGGGLKEVPATDLGAKAIAAAIERADIAPAEVDYVLMGMVVQAGVGQAPARQASIKAGLPVGVPSDTINKVCASSLRAVNLADALIRSGDINVVVGGGMESMSQAPYLLPGARWGYRMGDGRVVDAVIKDGLWCPFGDCHMGVYGSTVAAEYGVTREEQDQWAWRSQQRAVRALAEGWFREEIIPIEVAGSRGVNKVFDIDEGPRPDTTPERLAALKPAFASEGTITAGNAPGLSDGAAALVLMSRERAEELGLAPLATIISQGQVSQAPPYLHTVPYLSGKAALDRAGLRAEDLDLIEVNEAFAAVALTSMKLGPWDPEKVNVNGGAIALGHPIGASGARILMTLTFELRRRGGGLGLAAICSGGGQGEATVIRVEGDGR